MTKLSILMFYRRLVDGTCSRTYKLAIWAAMGFVVFITILFFILLFTGCKPFTAYWQKYDVMHPPTRYHCFSDETTSALGKAAGAFSVITDIYSLMLPAVLLMGLQITKRRKWGLIFVFSVGYM
jgi:hypothetical protein